MFVALQRIKVGKDWLEPGDEVPVEQGRDYGVMLRLGQIADHPDRRGRSRSEPKETETKLTAKLSATPKRSAPKRRKRSKAKAQAKPAAKSNPAPVDHSTPAVKDKGDVSGDRGHGS